MAIEEQLSTALDAPPDLASAIAPPGAETETIPTEAPVQPGASSLEGVDAPPESVFSGDKEEMVAGVTKGLSRSLLRHLTKKANPLTPTVRPKPFDPGPTLEVADAPVEPPRVNPITGAKAAIEEQAQRDSQVLVDTDLVDTHGFVKIGNKSYQVNFKNFNTDDDAKEVQANLAELYRGEIDAARGGVRPDESVRRFAQQLGVDEGFIRRFLAKENINPDHIDSIMVASKGILEASAVTLKDLAHKVHRGEGTTQDFHELVVQWDFHRQWMARFMGFRANVGRGLRANQTSLQGPTGRHTTDERADEMVALYGAVVDPKKLAMHIVMNDTVLGISKTVRGQSGGMTRIGAAGIEWAIGSMLSGLKTHIINPVGNALMWVKAPVDIQLASMLRFGLPNNDEQIRMGEATAYIVGEMMSIADAFHAAGIAFKTGEPYGQVAKFDMGPKALSAQGLNSKSWFGHIWNGLGHYARAPMERVIGPMDAWFKVQGERGKWAQLAYRHAVMDAEREGLDKAATLKRMDRYLNNPSMDVRERMISHARYNVFQNDLGDFGQSVQRAINKHGGAKLLVPFMRTPTNLMKVGLGEGVIGTYGGLRFFSKQYRERFFPKPIGKDGKGNDIYEPGAVEHAALSRARFITGSAITSYVAYLALNDRITGSGPRDKNERAALESTGWRARSLLTLDENGKIVGARRWDRMEPLSLMVGPIVDIIHAGKINADLDPNDPWWGKYDDAIWATTFAMSENTLNKSWMMGLHNFTRAAHTDKVDQVDRYFGQLANVLASASGARRDLRKWQDPYQREVNTFVEELKNATPYLSEDLGLKRDVYGVAKTHGQYLWEKEAIEQTPWDIELATLMENTGEQPIKIIAPTKQGVRLTSNEHSDYALLARAQVKMTADGNIWLPSEDMPPTSPDDSKWYTYRELLEEVLLNGKGAMGEAYVSMPTDFARVKMLKQVTSTFDSAGWIELLKANPDLQDRVMRKRQFQMGQMIGRDAAEDAMRRGDIPIIPPMESGPLGF